MAVCRPVPAATSAPPTKSPPTPPLPPPTHPPACRAAQWTQEGWPPTFGPTRRSRARRSGTARACPSLAVPLHLGCSACAFPVMLSRREAGPDMRAGLGACSATTPMSSRCVSGTPPLQLTTCRALATAAPPPPSSGACSWVIGNLYAPPSDGAAAVVHAASVPWGRERRAAAAITAKWGGAATPSARAQALPDLRFYARGLFASPAVTSWRGVPRRRDTCVRCCNRPCEYIIRSGRAAAAFAP